MSNTNPQNNTVHCDFCRATSSAPLYSPSGTKRGMKIWVCKACGLTQSHSEAPPDTKARTLSTDADWGNVRHGKGVRFEHLRQLMENHILLKEQKRILDVGANRGDFIRWSKNKIPGATILAVEPDGTITSSYSSTENVTLSISRIEDLSLINNNFNLVFCSHTLEHATSAASMLSQMHDAIQVGGFLVIEVPALEAICLPDIVEEYFIDKHPFHFDRATLIDYVTQRGFEVVAGLGDTDPLNISLLLRKIGPASDYKPHDGVARAQRNTFWIEQYRNKLIKNRQLLKVVVEKKLRPLGLRQKVAYWGAGRIFDALVKYGGLTHQDVFMLVDRYLHGIVHSTHDVAIDKPELLRLREPQVIVILGNSAENAMAKQAYEMGIRHIIKFSELMEQARDSFSNDENT